MNGREGLAAAGAAAILGLPVVGGSVGSLAADDSTPATTPEPVRTAAPDELAQAQESSRYWRRRAKRNWRYVQRLRLALRSFPDPVRAGLRCIHTGEGAWNAETGNGYSGGLQMDRQFQWYYGRPLVVRFGSASHWPAAAQLAVGEIAFYAGRGFGPWPNTRRMCGL